MIDSQVRLFLFVTLWLLKPTVPGNNAATGVEFKIVGVSYQLPTQIIILDDLSSYPNPRTVDSATIVNNRFQFSGHVTDSLTKMMIHTRDYKSTKSFWVENSTVHIELLGDNFQLTRIEGSALQKEQNTLDSLLEKIYDRSGATKNPIEREDLDSKANEVTMSFLKRHRNSIMSVSVLMSYAERSRYGRSKDAFARTKCMKLYDVLGQNVLTSNLGRRLQDEYILTTNKVRIGDKYSDFKQPNVNGDTIKLSDIHGKLILLEFWASNCGPCRASNPELVKLYSKYKSKGFEIVAVSFDRKKDAWVKAIEQDNLNWIHVSDLKDKNNEAGEKYGVLAIPYNFLIDSRGFIIDRGLSVSELNEKLRELLL
ncbi:MAG TPA: TlpA disulfide reductase family protein [Chryseolinea sp.]|nr:TlpA disulfide reductase family protein [Chryseolinea sp.]